MDDVGALNVIMRIFIRENQRVRGVGIGGAGDVPVGAETGVMQPGAKECQKPLEAGRSKEQTYSWSLQKDTALLIP